MRIIMSLCLVLSLLFNAGIAFANEYEINGNRADYILIEKSDRLLTLFSDNKVIKTYKIALGKNPEGHKIKMGDRKTPEGTYYIDSRKADSKYHLALHISYPNEIDTYFAEKQGLSPGNNIMIHGTGEEYAWMGKYHSVNDWTDGCIAVTNQEINEIWHMVPDGTKIKIIP